MKLMQMMMLSCLRATELMEKKIDSGDLSFVQNVQLSMHKSVCKVCAYYEEQSYVLDDILKHPIEKEVVKIDLEKLKADIIKKIGE